MQLHASLYNPACLLHLRDSCSDVDVSGSSWRARFGNGSLIIGDCDASIKQAGQWLACSLEVTYKKPTIEIQLWENLLETLKRHQKA